MANAFRFLVMTPAGSGDPGLAVAAGRAGHVGLFNAELPLADGVLEAGLEALATEATPGFGLALGDPQRAATLAGTYAARGLRLVVLPAEAALDDMDAVEALRAAGVSVVPEAIRWDPRLAGPAAAEGLIVKGHEAGGRVGEATSFILLQQAIAGGAARVIVRGGIGLHSAGAVRAGGAAGVVLDDQCLGLRECALAAALAPVLARMTGGDTALVEAAGGIRWRGIERPGSARRPPCAALLPLPTPAPRRTRRARKRPRSEAARGNGRAGRGARGNGRAGRGARRPRTRKPRRRKRPCPPSAGTLPRGRSRRPARRRPSPPSSRAASPAWAGWCARWLDHSARAVTHAAGSDVMGEGAGVAAAHGTRWPIMQGPMTRVSDTARFAQSVGEAGALPMVALALMRPGQADTLLAEAAERLAGKPWGVGLLGFAPSQLIKDQVEVALKHGPSFALIAGGRPDQAVALEGRWHPVLPARAQPAEPVAHVPRTGGANASSSRGANAAAMWARCRPSLVGQHGHDAAGRGHRSRAGEKICVLFAGGIHDAPRRRWWRLCRPAGRARGSRPAC